MTRKIFAAFLGIFMLAVMLSVPAYAEYWDKGNNGNSRENAYVTASSNNAVFAAELTMQTAADTGNLPEGIIQSVTLAPEVLENIANTLNVDSSQIYFVPEENIAPAEDPSQSMTYSVFDDNYEITGKLGVVKVDTSGMYAVKVTFTDELYAVVKDQNVSDFKICSLYDSELSSGQMRSAFITGLKNTWELFTLNGEKMETFGAKEFLIAGFMDAGTPFSMYIAKFMMAMPSADYMDEGRSGDSWEDAYVIDSVEDFVTMCNRSYSESGKYFVLTTDIDLSSYTDWQSHGFDGHFDGQGHTITVNIIAAGEEACLFSVIDTDGIAFRNLNIKGTLRAEGNTSDNAVTATGLAIQMGSGIIENCRFDGTIEAIGGQNSRSVYAAGIIRSIYTGATVRDCVFNGSITATGYEGADAGGIVCFLTTYKEEEESETIENCSVLSGSTISVNVLSSGHEYSGYAGGIIGTMYSNNDTVANCVVEATITGNAHYLGGIAGYVAEGNTLSGNTWPSEYLQSGGTGNVTPTEPVQPTEPDIPSNESHDTTTVSADLPEGIVQPVILAPEVVQNIARTLSIDASQIHFVSEDNIAPAEDPSQSMTDYVRDDNHEITGKLGVINVDTQGVYVVKVTLTDELFAVLKDQNVDNFKIYALSDEDPSDVDTSLISGLIGTWEILSLSGEKITQFGVREFLMVGMLNAGTPFSVYIAKILIALLLGGCNSGISSLCLGVAALVGFAALKFRKH